MAKKVRRKLEDEEAASFEFPVFDDVAFVKKEFELASGLTLAGLLALVIGLLAWALTVTGLPWYVPFPIGLALAVATPVILGRVRAGTSIYTKGDWAGLIFLVFFGFLAIWFLLVDLSLGGH